jgi:uncharacterized radical SAM superfamily Fe-S cluster-containing enzyme
MVHLLEVTGQPIPLQISGGEPTMRKDLPEIVTLAKNLGYRHIELITNGIKIAQRPALLLELKKKGLKAIYLQFDGLEKTAHLTIRGQDLTEVRCKAIEAARQAGLCCTLAVTVARGINDHEIGDILRFAIENIDTVRAINFQSATRFPGRFDIDAQHGNYSLPALLQLIEDQTGLPVETFRSEHMGHPLCNALSFVFVVNGKLEPLFKYISGEDVTAFLGRNGRGKIFDLFDGKKEFFRRYMPNPRLWKILSKAAPIFNDNPLNALRSKHILLFAKSFMPPEALDPDRVEGCCYGITDKEGVFSFCVFNNLYRFPADDCRPDTALTTVYEA